MCKEHLCCLFNGEIFTLCSHTGTGLVLFLQAGSQCTARAAVVNNLISSDWHFSPSGSIYIKAPWIPVTPPPLLCVLMFDLLKDQDPDAIALPCLLKLGVFTFCPTQKLVSLSSVALADRSHRDDLSSKVKDLFIRYT